MYKNRTSGIYCIKHRKTGRLYIGSSVHLEERLIRHRIHLKNGKHCNCYLQRSYNKHGVNAFAFEIIETCVPSDLLRREQYWIDYYDSTNKALGYNIKKDILRNLHSEESKLKIGNSNRGKTRSLAAKQRVGECNRGSKNGMFNKVSARRKLSDRAYIEIDRLLMQGYSLNTIAMLYNCSFGLISRIKNRKRGMVNAINRAYDFVHSFQFTI